MCNDSFSHGVRFGWVAVDVAAQGKPVGRFTLWMSSNAEWRRSWWHTLTAFRRCVRLKIAMCSVELRRTMGRSAYGRSSRWWTDMLAHLKTWGNVSENSTVYTNIYIPFITNKHYANIFNLIRNYEGTKTNNKIILAFIRRCNDVFIFTELWSWCQYRRERHYLFWNNQCYISI